MPEREKSQHLVLALRERIRLRALMRLGVERRKPRSQRGMDVLAAGRNLLDRLHEVGAGRLLHEVAAGTRGECLPDVPRVVLHREDEDAGLG